MLSLTKITNFSKFAIGLIPSSRSLCIILLYASWIILAVASKSVAGFFHCVGPRVAPLAQFPKGLDGPACGESAVLELVVVPEYEPN